jgi:NADPH:quinone reductase-like Zn-dependent oxidoreductase
MRCELGAVLWRSRSGAIHDACCRIAQFGQAARCEQFPDPVPGGSELIVQVRAASLKPVDRQLASGSHFASPRELPVVCGTDGIGKLHDGTRVFFGGTRPPYGAMPARTLVRPEFCFPVPHNINDEAAAALPNPGVSAWVALGFSAKLLAGEKCPDPRSDWRGW